MVDSGREHIKSLTDEKLDEWIESRNVSSPDYDFAVRLREKRQFQKLNKMRWHTVVMIILTFLCFLAAAIAVAPVVLSWLK